MKHKLCLLLIFALVLSSIADSSDDDDKDKDKHSEEDPEDEPDNNTDEEKGEEDEDGSNQEIGATLITEAPTSEDKKEGKNKNETKEVKEDEISDWDLDKMFGAQANEPKSEDNSAHHTQAPSPSASGSGSGFGGGTGNSGTVADEGLLGIFAGWIGNLNATSAPVTSAPVESATTPQPLEPTREESKDDSSEGTQGSHGTVGGNSFYPLPRQVDIWDRLFVLAAFPICFFAVLLKAEIYR